MAKRIEICVLVKSGKAQVLVRVYLPFHGEFKDLPVSLSNLSEKAIENSS